MCVSTALPAALHVTVLAQDDAENNQLAAQDVRRAQSGNSASSSGRYEPREGDC